MAYTIDIDGYIGDYYFGKSYIKSVLAKHAGKPVSVRINSYGGDVNHAIDIACQFEEHGDVTVDMFSFNASAATLIPTGAKKIRMHRDGFFLIHKVLSWVDAWGYMNEDNMQALIDQLEHDKRENEKITLVLARRYAGKTGKSTAEILNLMKQETWLTAEQAKNWGFVDEIFGKSEKINFTDSQRDFFNACGLPVPARFAQSDSDKSESMSDGLLHRLLNFLDTFSLNNQFQPKSTMNKRFALIMNALALSAIEIKDNAASFSETQLQQLEDAIASAQKLQKEAEEKLTALQAEKDALQKAKNDLQTEFDNFKASAGDTTKPVSKSADQGNGGDDGELAHINAAKELLDLLS